MEISLGGHGAVDAEWEEMPSEDKTLNNENHLRAQKIKRLQKNYV